MARVIWTSAEIEEARRLYDAGISYMRIGEALFKTTGAAYRLMQREAWPARPARRSGAPPSAGATAKRFDTPMAADSLAHNIESIIRASLRDVELRLKSSTAANAEKHARVLASLVKSLGELRKLEREAGPKRSAREGEDDSGASTPGPPRDMAELRAELAAHLARLRPDWDSEPAAGANAG